MSIPVINEIDSQTSTDASGIHLRQRVVQDYLLIWVATNIDKSIEDYRSTITKLRSVVNDIHIFTDLDEAVDFLTDINDIKVFLIADDTIDEQIVSLIHDVPQLDSVYIFCTTKNQTEPWMKKCTKIRGVYVDVTSICEALHYDAEQCDQDSIPLSFITVNEEAFSENLDRLEPSFMYTQIFKKILLDMKYDQKSIKDLANYYRQFYKNNNRILNIIDEFENNYQSKLSIWWYTRESFTYQMLNRALRTLEGDTIIHMGFFIRDLHQQIQQLHQTQINGYQGKSFIVYRGQGLSFSDFAKLRATKAGLLSFNNFLSTSTDRGVSLAFAESASAKFDTVGVIFEMSIDPSVPSASFASIQEFSYFKDEEEILFSMHVVFRVDKISQIDNNNSLYQVNLKLTTDDDKELRILTNHIQEEVAGGTGWGRLGWLLIQLSQYAKAEELYNVLLQQSNNQGDKAAYYTNLGYIKNGQGDYKTAIEYYEKSLEIQQKILPPNHPDLASSYNNFGLMYDNMGEYSKALSFYEKAFEIRRKALPLNHPHLAMSYNNIGAVYDNLGEFSKALSFYEKALEIFEKVLPLNHPLLATSYNNLGFVYDKMGEYSKALLFYEKALEIQEKTLPPNHPDLAQSYNNIGAVYLNMGEYSKALSFYEKAFELFEKTLPPNHHLLATSYNNIGLVHLNMGEYSKAFLFYGKALEVFEKTLPSNHPLLATSYNNIAGVYDKMGEYSKALSFYEKAREFFEKTLPPNHSLLATSYNNIAGVYDKIEEYSKAVSFYEKSFEIQEKTLPPNHPDLVNSNNNIAGVYFNMGEYSKALSFYEKTIGILEKALPPNHPDLAQFYNNIGLLYGKMREYSKALWFLEKAIEIFEKALPPNHPLLATSYNNIGLVYFNMGEYSKAFSFYEKALDFFEKTLPSNHPDLAISYNNIAGVYDKMGEYSKALSFYEKSLEIFENVFPANHSKIGIVQEKINLLKKNL